MLDAIPSQTGTYLLVFYTNSNESISVGRLGRLELVPGYYFYIGSAFGPGGLRARVRHHHDISARPHWHLDYIRPSLSLLDVWYSTDTIHFEHAWADSLYYTMQMQVPLTGLGSSDCRCESHFFYSIDKPDYESIHMALIKNQKMIALEMVSIK